ncbi:MAG: aldo/keto reductase, partial [Treponema sp.]|nr:aldo/keto reductase [Treponema sp.]
MNYMKLCDKGPRVSKLCLGTGSFGTAVPREAAFAQLDRFFEQGGNFVDSARVYADWVPGGHGASEKNLGAWMKDRKNRDKVVVSTKGAHPDLKTMHIPRMSREAVRSDLEESLEDLGTDYIDVYFLHRDDVSRPVGEILETLESFKKEGKILHYGCSNWTLKRMEEAGRVAASGGFEGFICDQIQYSLGDINRSALADKTTVPMDRDIYAWHEKTGKAVMAYTSTCGGYFSKKLAGKPVSPNAQAVYGGGTNQKFLEKLGVWEKELQVSAAVLVLAYV